MAANPALIAVCEGDRPSEAFHVRNSGRLPSARRVGVPSGDNLLPEKNSGGSQSRLGIKGETPQQESHFTLPIAAHKRK